MKNAVKRVSLLASEDTFKVKLELKDNRLLIHSANREEGEANEVINDCNYSGVDLTIAFNYRYLNSILSVIESDDVEMRMGKANEPALFFNVEDVENYSARFLLMPLRLS